jgi:predicted transposase YbfD/YdcC
MASWPALWPCIFAKAICQGNRIVKQLKEKKELTTGKSRRGRMDIRDSLAIIPDPRIERCKKHLLTDILLLCIIAMACGVESVEDIAFFGITHIQWLKQYLALPHGIPGADAILRVLGRIGHAKFEESFLNWTRGYFRERVQPGSVVAIDGKTVRIAAFPFLLHFDLEIQHGRMLEKEEGSIHLSIYAERQPDTHKTFRRRQRTGLSNNTRKSPKAKITPQGRRRRQKSIDTGVLFPGL